MKPTRREMLAVPAAGLALAADRPGLTVRMAEPANLESSFAECVAQLRFGSDPIPHLPAGRVCHSRAMQCGGNSWAFSGEVTGEFTERDGHVHEITSSVERKQDLQKHVRSHDAISMGALQCGDIAGDDNLGDTDRVRPTQRQGFVRRIQCAQWVNGLSRSCHTR